MWTLASALWSPSAEASVAEFNRVLLYLGVFLLVALLARPESAGTWADGLAAGIAAIALVALASRLFPSLFSQRGLASTCRRRRPVSASRSDTGTASESSARSGCRSCSGSQWWPDRRSSGALPWRPVPVIAADVYLASSRGAVATLLTGTLVLVADLRPEGRGWRVRRRVWPAPR